MCTSYAASLVRTVEYYNITRHSQGVGASTERVWLCKLWEIHFMQVLFNIAHSTLTAGNTAPPEMYCACGFVIEHDDWKCFPHIIHGVT